MKFHSLKVVSTRAATVVGAVVITAVVVCGSLDVAQATTEALANNSVTTAKILNNTILSQDIKDGTITAADIADNTIHGTDVTDSSLLGADIFNGSISTNDLAPAIRPRYAKVSTGASGTALIRGRGATSVSRSGNGEYDVSFDINVATCGWIATRNDDAAGGAANGEISVEQASSSDPNRLRIRLFTTAGAQADPESDDGFTVIVVC